MAEGKEADVFHGAYMVLAGKIRTVKVADSVYAAIWSSERASKSGKLDGLKTSTSS
jgi:hypothetical protein